MKVTEIFLSNQGSVTSLKDIEPSSVKGLPTLATYKGLELKKRNEGQILAYILINPKDGKLAAIARIKPPTKILNKFPSRTDPDWKQIFNVFVDPAYRGAGLAAFFYTFIVLTEGNTVVSDDAQTEGTMQLWRNRLVPNSSLQISAIDLTTGRVTHIPSVVDFDRLKRWIYENYKVYLIIQAA
jgi:hypothetical protein